jgi:4-amino-4-deoxy-L-arabinose transferase-like glycosyltransferase
VVDSDVTQFLAALAGGILRKIFMNSVTKQAGHPFLRDIVILTVLISVFFGFMIGNRPLSIPDEGRYVEIPREMVETGNYLTPRLNGVKYFEKPVLFYWFEALSIRLFGLHEATLRFWPAFFALFGCISVYIAGRRLFGRRAGLAAAIVLATGILYYSMSRAIILDMPVTAFLTAALISFLIGMHEVSGIRRRFFLWSFYVFCALAVLTKGLIGIVIPGMIIGAWIIILGEWRVLRTMYLPSGIALFLLIAAPWHVLVIRANPEFFHFYFIQEHFLRYLTKMHGRYHPAWYFIPIILVGLFPWSSFLMQAIRHNLPATWRERHEHRDALFLMLWAGLVFLFFSASDSKLAPYILPVFPPLSILIGRYLAEAWDSKEFPGLRLGYHILLTAALLLAGAFLVAPYVAPAENVQALGVYSYLIAITLAVGAGSAWVLTRYRGFLPSFIAIVAMSVLFLLEVNAAAPRVETKSIKQLAATLKPLLKPGDEVASYSTYYQDLPVYLEKRIIVVDWKGELEFGTQVEDTTRWMMEADAYWKRWQGPETLYMITSKDTYNSLRQNPKLKLFPVAEDRQNIVLSNREAKR